MASWNPILSAQSIQRGQTWSKRHRSRPRVDSPVGSTYRVTQDNLHTVTQEPSPASAESWSGAETRGKCIKVAFHIPSSRTKQHGKSSLQVLCICILDHMAAQYVHWNISAHKMLHFAITCGSCTWPSKLILTNTVHEP